MLKIVLAAGLLSLAIAGNGPLVPCGDNMFVSDQEDCCRFHWCMGNGDTVEMRCAPGSRVPTWWTTSVDHEVPCNVDRREEVSCLRCDIADDVRMEDDRDDCINVDCGEGCTCQDLWQMHYCICDGDVGPVFDYVAPTGDYCGELDPCANGATCHSQWDDYWCECPNGFTGKNCEVFFCDESTCLNGGTCVLDDVNYHCECVQGFTGPCCDDGRQPAIVPPTTTTTTTTTTTEAPIVTDPITESDVVCEACETKSGNVCNLNAWDCDCNPCPNFDDNCEGNTDQSLVRVCSSNPDLSGTPFSLVFMQNRPDDTDQREFEIYVTAAGNSARDVRVYTPYVPEDSICYFNIVETIQGFAVRRFVVPNPQCFEMIGSRKYFDKMIKVEAIDGGDLLVYAVNRDQWSADAWIAYPDSRASTDFTSMSYGPATYGTQFSCVALENDTTITITYTGEASPGLPGTTQTLMAGESMQVQSEGDLTGTRMMSDKPVHCFSGNIRILIRDVIDDNRPDITSGSRDHIIEQLIPYHAWGYYYIIQPIPNRVFGDHIRMVSNDDNTVITVVCSDEDDVDTTQIFNIDAGQFAVFDAYSGYACKITSNNKILVAQITKSKDSQESSNDPSLILVPAIEQFSNRYIFATPEFSGGASGISKPYNTSFILLGAKTADRDGIEVRNSNNGVTFRVTDQTLYGEWKQIPDSDYWVKAVQIEFGNNVILHPSQAVSFMCLFYGMDDRESLGFPVGMMLYTLNENGIVPTRR